MTTHGTAETTREFWVSSNNPADIEAGTVQSTTVEGTPNDGVDRNTTFALDTGVSGVNIGLNFYFQ